MKRGVKKGTKYQKLSYMIEARCDGMQKFFTVTNVCEAHLSRVAENIASSLFGASMIAIISKTVLR